MSPAIALGNSSSMRLRAAAIAALACVLVAIAAELRTDVATRPESAGFPPILVSLGLLCIVGLAIRRAPSAAWCCAAAAAGLGAIELVGVDRAAAISTPPVLFVATAIRAVPLLIAAGYLRSRPPQARGLAAWLVGGAGLVIGLIVLLAALAAGWADPRAFDADWSRFANRLVLIDVAGLIALGAGLDASPAWARADVRWRRAGESLRWTDRARILVEELVPTTAGRRRAAVEAERTRLAAELHASVLPPLRTALAASRAGSMAAAERGLGQAVDEVEQLMVSREPVIVDALGLLAGLEWLAERLQLRAGIPVEVDVEIARERPPSDVERAAFRVTQLAIDNAARHSEASSVRIAGTVFGDVVALSVEDDGIGFGHGQQRPTGIGRGLRDMDAAADAVGASVTIAAGDAATAGRRPGTLVRFEWRSR